MQNSQSAVIDLGISDMEYLDRLSQGRDPVQEALYTSELVSYGYDRLLAERVAQLLGRRDCSIDEKKLVNQTLQWLWQRLTQG